jgi:hypothetical protein
VPDYHPDLDPFAHRDGAEPDEQPDAFPDDPDRRIADLSAELRRLAFLHPDDSTPELAARLYLSYASAAGVYARGAPARPDADPDLRVPAGREPDGHDPQRRDAGLRAAGGEPGAGAAAVSGGGALPATLAYEHEYRPRPFRHAHRHAHPDDDGRARVNDASSDAHEHAHYPDDDGDHHPV